MRARAQSNSVKKYASLFPHSIRTTCGCGAATSSRNRFRRRNIFIAVDEHKFHFGAVVENLAFGHQKVRDLALLDAAKPVLHAVNLSRRQSQGAQSVLPRQAVI